MPQNDLTKQVIPQINLKDIKDPYIKKNFEEIQSSNAVNNQLQGFKFFEKTFEAGEGHFRLAHGLGYIPQDIMVTKICGPGLVQFNRDLFSSTHLDMTVSDACTIRFFVGSYWQNQEKAPSVSDDRSVFSGVLDGISDAGTPISTTLPGLTAQDIADITTAAAAAAATAATAAATIAAAAAAAVPGGCVLPYAGTTAPTGYLLCDGTQVSRVTYAALFAIIGITHGSGDGATTFHTPDYRGRFLRGRDGGIARDPNRTTRTAMNSGGATGDNVGSVQTDAFQGHYHGIDGQNGNVAAAGPTVIMRASAPPTYSAMPAVTAATTDGSNGTPRTTSETRPLNAYVNYIIKT